MDLTKAIILEMVLSAPFISSRPYLKRSVSNWKFNDQVPLKKLNSCIDGVDSGTF